MLKHAPLPLKRKHASPPLFDTVRRLLKQAADSRNLNFGKTIHAQLIITCKYNEEESLIISNSLINLYVKCGRILNAHNVFDEMPERNVVSWSTLMTGYLHTGFSLEVIHLFKNLIFLGFVPPNEYVLSTVLSACSDRERVDEGRQCHGHALKSGLVFHQYVKNSLINMYSRCSDVKGAVLALEMVSGSDVVSYNSVLKGLLDHGYLGEGLQMIHRMVDEQVPWDTDSYVSAFGLCSRVKALKLGSQVHCQFLKADVTCDTFLGSAMIDMYGRCSKLSSAKRVFDDLKSQNVATWTAMLAAYFQNGRLEEAVKLFLSMELKGISPNDRTFAAVLNSSAGLSALALGKLLHVRLSKSGFLDHINAGNALINMYSKSGDIEAAANVFSCMMRRDSVTWNVMLSGFSHHGLGREALAVFYDMRAAEECPNYITFVGVLSACSHLGRVEEGFYYFDVLMQQMGIEPGLEHYTCIVSLLGRAGRLADAEHFMRSRPIKWDVVAWRSLLSACHLNRNYGLGRRIAKMVLEVDPDDVGTYILMSNMYAKANIWDEVVRVRKMMRERNIKKEPGVSWIEIKNKNYVFASEDSRHPESSKIHEMVRKLLAKIKPLGYVPDIASVLHDVEQEQKEEYLVYHSEKLAIAYGIMKTPPNAPLRVIKNLRMCDDCHSAAKFISKVTSRKIIVRDVNRFHNFEGGHCSCADYW